MKSRLKQTLERNKVLGRLTLDERHALIAEGYDPWMYKRNEIGAEYMRFIHIVTGNPVQVRY